MKRGAQIGNKSTLGLRGKKANAWKGGIVISKNERWIYMPHHPKAIAGKYVPEHKIVAERALGKILPEGAVVHHVNLDRLNNDNSNLIVCESQSYHNYIHQRKRAFDASGNPNWLRCRYCKKYDAPENLYVWKKNGRFVSRHKECHRKAEKIRNSKMIKEIR